MYTIITVTEKNLTDYPQVICFINPKNKYHGLKITWLKERFQEGLKIKLLQTSADNKIAGFIEYTPGEYAWRAVEAKNYLFIHCLWVYPNKNKDKGFGSALIHEVIKDAQNEKKAGVAVITSDKSFMAKKDVFLKNDFTCVEELEDFQLLAQQFDTKALSPHLYHHHEKAQQYQGWHMLYSRQCPWVARFIEEVQPILKSKNIDIKIQELKTAQEAQNAPSVYATFNLIKDGKLLADRYISVRRFLNIVERGK